MSKINFLPAALLSFIIASFFIHPDISAQPWIAPTEDGANFFDIQRSFNEYWEGKTPERGKGYKVFKRWEHFWEYRVNPDGTFPSPEAMLSGLEDYNQMLSASSNKGNSMAAWTAMGPSTTGGGYAGLGRINAIAFHPTNSSIIWVGSPSGGLWKTTDGGATWSTGYDNFSVLGVSSILVTPSNPNIMYVATGDGDAADTRSIGVYKSTDGGATWAATGLTFTLANYVLIRKLLMDPNDEAHILAATSAGLYRTTNSGTSWTKVVDANFYDVEAQSGATANNFYACTGSRLYRSTNNGLNWTLVQTISGSGRIALGYSPADTTAVVALCSKNSDSGFLGFYRSANSGASYDLQSSAPNLLGWASDGSDSGGQGWYDLVVAVDPTNASTVYVGGVNVWKSTDAGVTWTVKATWNGAGGVQTVHADHHAMEWQNNTTLFDGNDGGIYKTVNGGTNWTHHTNGMQISQMYRLGVSQTTNAVIAGLQDNGTKLRSANGTWTDEIGGDGMECAIDYTNAQFMYGELYYGDFFRSSNGGASWSDLNPGGQDGTGAWVTPYIISSNSASTLYIGYNDVYKTTDRGNTWTAISTNLSSSDLTVLADAPSDANVIYAGRSSALYRTINGGTNWATMTIPAGAGSLTYLCVSPGDANVIYATMSNYTAGNKVYKSTNGGASWTNISGTLPNVPANCIIYQNGSPEGLYVGMDVGVYYRDNITNAWALVGTGLPNVIISELEIRYSTGKLRAATYGRGLWETDINCVSPVVNAPTVTQPTCTVTTGTIVVNATGNGTLEYSINGGTSWQTSSTFSSLATGSYNIVVRLQATPTCSTTYSGNPVTIVAPTPPAAFTVTGGGTYCSGGVGVPVGLSGSQTGVNYQLRLNGVDTGAPVSGTGAAISFGNQTAAGTYTVVGTSTTNSCTTTMTGSATVTINSLPSASISVTETSGATNNDGIICAGASATLTASGGGTYLWNTGATTSALNVTPSATITYTVTVTNSNNCTATATRTITVNPLPSASISVADTSGATNNDGIICAGASATLTASGGGSYSWNTGATTSALNVTPSATTTYTVTVTNANSCTATATRTITVNPLPSASISVAETSGVTNNDGIICAGASATLTATGGGPYLWSSGSTSSSINVAPSATTTYTVTVTGTGGCTATSTTTITVNSLPVPSVTVTESSGSGINDGIIEFGDNATLTASGGGTYQWSTGSTAAAITVSPGVTTTYTVTVTNTSGCSATATTTITVSQQQAPAITVTESSGISGNDGIICVGASATLTASGGNSYSWSIGSTAASIVVSPSVTTTYTVTVTAVNGTTVSLSAVITVNTLPVASISVVESSGIAGNDGIICNGASATLTASGGGTYSWSTGGTGAAVTVSPSATTTYTVTVTNTNGCTATATRTITVNTLPAVTVSVSETSGQNNNDGILCAGAGATLTASGGGTYLWSTGSTSVSISVSPSATTTYTVTVTNASGCTASAVRTVTVNTLPTVNISVSESSGISNDGTICNGSSATLAASGGATYLWSNGSTPAAISVSPSATTTYTVTATDANVCSGTKTSTITVASPPVLTTLSSVCGSAGTVITVSGANFTGTTQVRLNGTVCPTFTVINASQINVTMPFGGSITAASVTTPCGTGNLLPSLSVTSFSPATGPAGSLITISGLNLGCLQSVTIGGVPQIILSNTATTAVIFLMPGTPNGTITASSGTGAATSAGSFTVTATPYPYHQQGSKLTGTGATGTAQQGTSVAISADGNTAIIGGPTDNSSAGAAWIYVRNGSAWSQQGSKLVGTGATGAAKQGTSVAISADGNTAVLGGPTDNMGAGAVWIFTRTGTTWSQQGSKLTGSGAVGAAQQGTSVSISANGNVIASGGQSDNSFAGATWIFTRTGTTWSQQGSKLVGTGASGASRQGCSVSLSSDGKTMMTGGYNDATRKGAAWVFTQSGGVWTQQGAKLVGSGASSDSYQGWSVALSANGNTAAIGGPNDNTLKGAVWIFTRNSGVWSQQGNKLVGTGATGTARQGSSVAVSADGNTLVEGGYGDNGNKGAMWVYTRSGSSWTQQGAKVSGSGGSGSPKQGSSVALSSTGSTAALGGPTDASNKGAVWIFFSSVSLSPTRAETREDETVAVNHTFILSQNTPNPFTGRTNIGFSLPESCSAEWQITDMNGRLVLALKREYPAGDNTEAFDMSGYQGVYWYTLKTPFGVKTGKMVVVW